MTNTEMEGLKLPGYRVEHKDGRPDSPYGGGVCIVVEDGVA